MPRKSKVEKPTETSPDSKVELTEEITNPLPEILSEAEKVVTAVEEKVVEVAQKVLPVVENTVEDAIKKLPGIWVSILDYVESVGLEEAIKLLQKILNIAKTGVLDETTKSAWLGAYDKPSLIEDYNNLRKDSKKNLNDVKLRSRQALN